MLRRAWAGFGTIALIFTLGLDGLKAQETEIDAAVTEMLDLQDAVDGQIQENQRFWITTDPISIGDDPRVVQFYIPQYGNSAPYYYVGVRSEGMEPVVELYDGAIFSEAAMVAILNSGDRFGEPVDDPENSSGSAILKFPPPWGGGLLWLSLREANGETGEVTVFFSDYLPGQAQ